MNKPQATIAISATEVAEYQNAILLPRQETDLVSDDGSAMPPALIHRNFGDDVISGGAGNETIHGGPIEGTGQVDTLGGDDGDDLIDVGDIAPLWFSDTTYRGAEPARVRDTWDSVLEIEEQLVY